MTVKPIRFAAPEVRALLDGRKTQTRVVLKLPTRANGHLIYEHPKMGGWEATTFGGGGVFSIKNGERVPEPEKVAIWHRTRGVCIATPYQPGDLLYGWFPSVQMPREFSRLCMEVTRVRVERVQDISGADARAEGIDIIDCYGPACPAGEDGCNARGCFGAREEFHRLWDSINAKRGYGWDANPWVVVVEWEKVIHQNVDEYLSAVVFNEKEEAA